MTLELLPLNLSSFSARPSLESGMIAVKLVGNGDMDAAGPLGAFLINLHSEALRTKVPGIKLDFTDLYFLNSSCLKHIASLIALNRKAGPGRRLKLIFRTESALNWQDRCLEALHYLDVESVVIEGAQLEGGQSPSMTTRISGHHPK